MKTISLSYLNRLGILISRRAKFCSLLLILAFVSPSRADVINEESGNPAVSPYFSSQVFQEIARPDNSFDANGILYSSNIQTKNSNFLTGAVVQLDGSTVSSDATAVPNGFFSGRNSATMRVANGSPNLRYSTSAGQGSRTQIQFNSAEDAAARSVFHWHVTGTNSAPYGMATGRLDFLAGQFSDKDFFYIFEPGNGALSVLGPGDYEYTLVAPPLNTPIDVFFWSSAFAFVDFGQAPAGSNFTSVADYGSTYELFQIDLYDENDQLIPEWSLTDLNTDKIVFTQDGPVPQCNPPPANLAGWYPGDGDSQDVQAGNNGTFIGDDGAGDAEFSTGTVGAAFDLDGVNDYVDAPAVSAQDPTAAGSMDAWVYLRQLPSSAGHIMQIIGKGSTGADFDLQADQDDHFRFYVANGNSASSTTVITPNVWYHVAGTWDASGIRIYVNGTLEGINPIANLTRTQSNQPLQIGHQPAVGGRFFNGLIDEPQVFTRALLLEEIKSIAVAGSAGQCHQEATLALTSAVSRKHHGASGDFDLPLMLAGQGTVEPRSGGPTQLLFTFSENVVAADGAISANEFTIANAAFGSASISGNQVTLNLTGVVDQSVVSISLSGINSTGGSALSGDNDVDVRALLGDASQNRIVALLDFRLVSRHVGEPIDQNSGNYRLDLDLDGAIGGLDRRIVRQNKGHTVP